MITITMIRSTVLLPAAAVLALTGAGLAASGGATGQAVADPAVAPAAASMAGHWLRDSQGNIIGSVRRLTDGGRTAILVIGGYCQPGSHEVRVAASQLSVNAGQVTLRPEVAEAMNVVSQR